MKPQVLSTKAVYQGNVFDIRIDQIREGEVEYHRDIVVHAGSAVIVPVFADMTVGMVRQYRHAAAEYLLEVPAGLVEKGEDPLEGAKRELEEEVGVVAATIEKLSEFYVSPGFLTEIMHLYLATDLTETSQRLEGDELIEVERIPLVEALEMIKSGDIRDAKTMIGLTLAAAQLEL